jgi:hypothetical protein
VTNLLSTIRRSARYDDGLHGFNGNMYWGVPASSWRPNEEGPASGYLDAIANGLTANGVVFGCERVRTSLFSEARFQFRMFNNGKPGDLWGNPSLGILEEPWPNGTTGDLLIRMLLDADMGGSAFVARRHVRPDRLMRMRPDWVSMVLGSEDEPGDPSTAMDADFLGVIYHPGGRMSGHPTIALAADEVAHFAGVTHDPLSAYRGMSWLVPLLNREVAADSAATAHKLAFFANGATPQIIMEMGADVTPEDLQDFVATVGESHEGWNNAYKTLYVGGGATPHVVGKDLQQLDFKVTQGAGETRIAQAAGVHPVIAGLSEGLAGSSLNAGNFNSAARLVADATLRPLWRAAAGALSAIVPPPSGSQLWIDERDISFLADDRKDAADAQFVDAQAIRQLVDAQFVPESVVAAITAQDLSMLKHSGIPTVQGQSSGPIPAELNGSPNGTMKQLSAEVTP